MGRVSDWLLGNYGSKAKAVVGSYRRRLDDGTNDAQTIMEDLRRFCSIYDTPATLDKNGRLDADATLVNVGRLQVFQHIAHVLGVTEDELKIEEATDDRSAERRPDAGSDTARPRYAPDDTDTASGNATGPDAT